MTQEENFWMENGNRIHWFPFQIIAPTLKEGNTTSSKHASKRDPGYSLFDHWVNEIAFFTDFLVLPY